MAINAGIARSIDKQSLNSYDGRKEGCNTSSEERVRFSTAYRLGLSANVVAPDPFAPYLPIRPWSTARRDIVHVCSSGVRAAITCHPCYVHLRAVRGEDFGASGTHGAQVSAQVMHIKEQPRRACFACLRPRPPRAVNDTAF